MVKAELSYNPYMLETEIKFNGQTPHVNSLVEKYQGGMLQDWISELPSIFHDEMNGYDFELEFAGTPRDFSELKKSFKQAGVSDEQVELFHKSELEDRETKLQRIEALLAWLSENPNENFDNELFRKDNALLFDGAYSFVVIQSEDTEQPDVQWTDATIEVVKDVRELNNTDLTFTPIIISLNENMLPVLQRTIRYLSRKKEVDDQQIFFKLENSFNEDSIFRTIKDMGFARPRFIKSFEDDALKKYFEIYPETDYIINSIKMFRQAATEVEKVLENEKARGEKTNSAIDEQILLIEEHIQKLREADEEIVAKSNIDKPAAFTTAKNLINNRLLNWRKKKTKTTIDEEAERLAEELSQECRKYLDEFTNIIDTAVEEIKESIDVRVKSIFATSGCEKDFPEDAISLRNREEIELPVFIQELLGLHVKEKVLKRTPPHFFLSANAAEEEFEIQTAYYMQKWREFAFSIIDPIIDNVLQERLNAVVEYNDQIKKAYDEHLHEAIKSKIAEESELSKQLSSDAKRIQQDGSWLAYYKQQLKVIERG